MLKEHQAVAERLDVLEGIFTTDVTELNQATTQTPQQHPAQQRVTTFLSWHRACVSVSLHLNIHRQPFSHHQQELMVLLPQEPAPC